MRKRLFFAVVVSIALGGIALTFGGRLLSIASAYLFGMRACQPDSGIVYVSDQQIWRVDEKREVRPVPVQSDLPISMVAKSPNHRYMAYSVRLKDNRSQIYMACADGSQPNAVAPPSTETLFSWLNADILAFDTFETADARKWANQGRSFTIDVLTKQVHEYENPLKYPLGQYVLNPRDPNLVGYVDTDGGDFWFANLQTGTKAKIISAPDTGDVESARWSPDGTQLAFVLVWKDPDGQWQHSIYTFERATGGTRVLTEPGLLGEDQRIDQLRWSPDSRRLVFVVNDLSDRQPNRLYVLSLDDGKATNLGVDLINFYSFTWSPDSQQIAFTSERGSPGGKIDIFVVSVVTKRVNQLTDSPTFKYWLSW